VQNKEIIILHKSAIVQKGLNALLYIHQRSEVKIINTYADLKFLSSIKKSVLFVDAELDLRLNEFKSELSKNENIVIAVDMSAKEKEYTYPFQSILCVKDSELILSKKLDSIFAVNSVDEENHTLTNREKDILENVARGLSSQDIAEKLFISRHTVITHRKNICRKLGIKTVSGLTLYALVNKII